MVTLYADEGCPFAHRVLALLGHLGVRAETHLAELGAVPDGLHAFSPSGRIPFLVHEDVAIGESRVMLEHLAEAFGFADAYPTDLPTRTRHRHAMALFDVVVTPYVFAEKVATPKDEARLDECLSVLEGVAGRTTMAPEPSILAFHVAPMWHRLLAWRPNGVATRAIRARRELSAWLDAAAALPSVARTSPDAATMLALARALARHAPP
jgi:glutathione S-transferase